MEHPSERGLTLSLTWTSGARKKSLELPLGAVLRVAAVLGLCALSYQVGLWRARLDQDAAAVASVAMSPIKAVTVNPDGVSGAQAPGQPVGEPQDVITPLNVRDPSALVMGPGVSSPPPATDVPPAPRKRRR